MQAKLIVEMLIKSDKVAHKSDWGLNYGQPAPFGGSKSPRDICSVP